MQTLVLNVGSSSIKFSLFRSGANGEASPELLGEGQLAGMGGDAAVLSVSGCWGVSGDEATRVKAETLPRAVELVLDAVSESGVTFDAVGYRVVHPGAVLQGHQRITPEVLRLLEEAKGFAPLHDPEAVMLIRAAMPRYPWAAHYACFDTVFHGTMPDEARTYPLPAVYREGGVRRYGFHGLSCESVVRQMGAAGALPARTAIAHLGSGCSVTALLDGRSVDTTMGLTPTGGVVMGTRSGDLDPGLVLYLLRRRSGSREEAVAAVEALLNHGSGTSALSGLANDMRTLRAAAKDGNKEAQLALKVFTRSIAKTLGGFWWLLGGLDAVVFTGGIGEHDAETRREVLAGVAETGMELDSAADSAGGAGLRRVSIEGSRTAVYTAPAQEELMIAILVERMMRGEDSGTQAKGPE